MSVVKIFSDLTNVLLQPKKTFPKLSKKEIPDSILGISLGSLVPGLITFLIILLLTSVVSSLVGFIPFFGMILKALSLGLGLTAAVVALLGYPILGIIIWVILGIIIWAVATAIGGKASLEKFLIPFGYLIGAIMLVIWIPLFNILVALYSLYLLYTLLQTSMKLSADKAIVAILLLFLVGVLLSALIVTFGFMAAGMAAGY